MTQVPSHVKLESLPCPNGCRQESIKVMQGEDILHNLPGVYSIYRCLECGLERTNPRPTQDTMGFYYPDNYGPYQGATYSKPKGGIKNILFQWLGLADRSLPKVRPGRMLEIGCSSGSYMQHAHEMGWEVEGIEFSSSAAEQAKFKGFQVQVGGIETAHPPEEPFDIVVGWMVLEHLHQPVTVLKTLKEWTNRNGYLVLSVPDRNSIARRIFKAKSYDLQLPTHLYHFDADSLEKTLRVAGWKIERIFWQRNCNTLLKSLEYWAEANQSNSAKILLRVFSKGRIGAYARLLVSLVLGITRQSGRIEVWARPLE